MPQALSLKSCLHSIIGIGTLINASDKEDSLYFSFLALLCLAHVSMSRCNSSFVYIAKLPSLLVLCYSWRDRPFESILHWTQMSRFEDFCWYSAWFSHLHLLDRKAHTFHCRSSNSYWYPKSICYLIQHDLWIFGVKSNIGSCPDSYG